MPDFLDEFASSIGSQKEPLKEKILRGKSNPLQDTFRKHFEPLWKPLTNIDEYASNVGELGVTAVDSSLYMNLMSTGGIFYVIRSLAVCKDKENKRLQTNVFFTKSGLLEAHYYIGAKMEMLEFQTAIDALRNGFECNSILIDGSLYGRAMHVPVETKIEEDRTVVLEYFKTYAELLDLCRKKGICIAGVSSARGSAIAFLQNQNWLKKTDRSYFYSYSNASGSMKLQSHKPLSAMLFGFWLLLHGLNP